MFKTILAVVLIFFAGGTWFALDYLNKQEKARTKEMVQEIEQSRMEAKLKAQRQTNFEALIHAVQSNCETAAENAHNEYMLLVLKATPAKRKTQAVIPQNVMNESTAMLANAKAECQQIAIAQQQKGL